MSLGTEYQGAARPFRSHPANQPLRAPHHAFGFGLIRTGVDPLKNADRDEIAVAIDQPSPTL
jgi:hypothetical protein